MSERTREYTPSGKPKKIEYAVAYSLNGYHAVDFVKAHSKAEVEAMYAHRDCVTVCERDRSIYRKGNR